MTTCGKCDGTGRIEAFAHIHNGRCFACGGTGTVSTTSATDKGTRTASKTIELMGLTAHVSRFGNMFAVETTDGTAHIDATAAKAGRIELVDTTDGYRAHRNQIAAELAAQLR